jgi:thioredoxin 1
MTNRRLFTIIGAGCATLLLVALLFVGGIVGTAFYTLGHSEAAETARTFLRNNERLRQDLGEVRDFGWFVTGSVNVQNTDGDAELSLKVIGAKRTAPARVWLAYRDRRDWRVTRATYETADGKTVSLFDPYTEAAAQDAPEAGEPTGTPVAGFDEQGFRASVLEAEGPVLVFVGSPSSLDSLALEALLEKLDGKYTQNVTLIGYNVGEQPAVLQRLNVTNVPTLIMFESGRERERLAGAITREQVTDLLDKYTEGK